VQTTLLGIAIALILALVAALVGPHFVDWNQYRAEFETQASRFSGLTVNINGPIEARLLPTPMLTLTHIEMARPGEATALRARSLRIEFSLAALMRGDWRASEVRLDGPEFALGLDASGRLNAPALAAGVDLDAVSVERLEIIDGLASFVDAASGARLLLEKLEFRGELRSLIGPVKGEGAFILGGVPYPYRIAAGRVGEGGVRLRLSVDPIDRPAIEADALVVVERGVPRFEGSIALARPVGRAPDGIIQPWRVTSRVRGDSSAAVLEQIEFQYGPDERALKLRGDARLAFGRKSQLDVNLASTQIDLDRVLDLPEPTRKRPLVAVKSFADFFGGAPRPPLPIKLGISIENVTLAGAMLQRVSGEVVGDADNWNLDVLEFRAPGATQVGLSGRLNVTGQGIAFDGRAKVEARDPRGLAAWLSDRADAQAVTAGFLRAEGDVKLGSDRIAIDGLTAEIDRMTMQGRLSYAWASAERPPRIEAALSAPDIDFDRIYGLAQGMLADTPFEWPREGALSLKVDRAVVAGVETRRADIAVQFDRRGFEITRLAIGDFGGAALAVKGRVDAQAPRGTVTIDLDARSLDGVATLVEKYSASASAEFRRRAARFVPAKVQASLTVAGASNTGFRVEGAAGAFKISLQGQTEVGTQALTLDALSRVGTAKLSLTGRLEAGDGGALIELVGLDRLIVVDKRPGQLRLTASGAPNGDLAVDAQLAAGGLDVSSKGTVRLAGAGAPSGAVALRVASANVRNPRPIAAGRPGDTLPVAFAAKLTLAENVVDLTDIAGKAAGSDLGGRLKVGFAKPITLDGDLDVAEINLPAVIAAAIGTPQSGAATGWPAEPFEQGLLGEVSGRIKLRSAHVALTPRLAAKNVRAVAHLDPSELAFDEIDGSIAGGRVAGNMSFERGGDGVTASGKLRFAGADLAELVRGGPPPLSGRLTADVSLEGTGRSPVALIGSLKGEGTFTVQDAQIQRLDPGAFDAVIRSTDQGLPIDVARIRERMDQALAVGPLPVSLAEGQIAVVAGQIRLANMMVRAQGAELALSGNVALAEDAIDARLLLTGPARADAPAGTAPPDVAVTLKGPIDAPKRTLEAAAFTNWLALRALEQHTRRIDALESGQPINLPAPGEGEVKPPPQQPAPSRTVRQPQRPRPPQSAGQAVTPPAPVRPPPQQPPLDLRPAPSRSLLDNLLGR